MSNLENIPIKETIEHIRNKRIENRRKFDENYKKAEKLIESGKFEEAQKLTREDVLGYYPVYAEAEKKEKAGKLEEAAELYWRNIYTNGTDAPANFKRLLVVLGKLGRLSDELKVAEIYLKFINKSDYPKIEKRIEGIKRKMSKWPFATSDNTVFAIRFAYQKAFGTLQTRRTLFEIRQIFAYYKSEIMKMFPINKKLCLLNSFLNKYADTMRFFAWELKKFRTRKYITEKMRDFPFRFFGDTDRENIFFNAVANAFFEMCLISAFKLSNDTSKGAYTIKNFRDDKKCQGDGSYDNKIKKK